MKHILLIIITFLTTTVQAQVYLHVDLRDVVQKPQYKMDGIYVNLDQISLPENPLPNKLSEYQGAVFSTIISHDDKYEINGYPTKRCTNELTEWFYLTPQYCSEPLRRQQEIQARMSYISLMMCHVFGARYLLMGYGPRTIIKGYNQSEIADLTSWWRAQTPRLYDRGYYFAWRPTDTNKTPFDSSFTFKSRFDYTQLVSIEILAYRKKHTRRIP